MLVKFPAFAMEDGCCSIFVGLDAWIEKSKTRMAR